MKGQESFNEIILRYRGLLYSVCNRYKRNGLSVDDLLQETTLSLWDRRETLYGISTPMKQAGWIWRVARSTCIDLHRRTPEPTPLPENYEKPTEDQSLHDALHELIAMLPEPDRTIAEMHIQGFDYEEIGKATGLSKTNIGTRLTRIKVKLKEIWNEK